MALNGLQVSFLRSIHYADQKRWAVITSNIHFIHFPISQCQDSVDLGGHGPFGLSAMPGRDPFAAHREQFFNMGPSLFHRDPFLNSMGSLMGRDPFSSGTPFEHSHSNRRNPGEAARGRGGDHFAYEFQSWSSSGNVSGRTEERHFSVRGSSDDRQHHVTAAVRDRDGNVTSRQVFFLFLHALNIA